MEEKNVFEAVTAVIPSLNPDEKLTGVVESLIGAGFRDLLLVNDGSDAAHATRFGEIAARWPDYVTVLTHEVNRGKGRALKTAFAWLWENRPDGLGAVTLDGDGQHTAADTLACAEKMKETGKLVLGCRDFSGPDVPRRSRFGNGITSGVFRLFCGMKLSDTQTGLRSFPRDLFPALLEIEGERFEYETNMLLEAKKRGFSLCEVPIETVYLEENKSSHFRAVRDSIRVYGLILRFLLSSCIAALIDIAVYALLYHFLHPVLGEKAAVVAICTVGARIVSSAANLCINKKTVFRSDEPFFPTLVRYYALAIPLMLTSALVVWLLTSLIGDATWISTLIKAVVDTVLFLVSFRIQHNWVFAGKKPTSEDKT